MVFLTFYFIFHIQEIILKDKPLLRQNKSCCNKVNSAVVNIFKSIISKVGRIKRSEYATQ